LASDGTTSRHERGAGEPGPRRGRPRKVVLVESRRSEATQRLLGQIEGLELKRKGGEREWVEVYDWRLLEAVTRSEARPSRSDENVGIAADGKLPRELFRKHWVGLA